MQSFCVLFWPPSCTWQKRFAISSCFRFFPLVNKLSARTHCVPIKMSMPAKVPVLRAGQPLLTSLHPSMIDTTLLERSAWICENVGDGMKSRNIRKLIDITTFHWNVFYSRLKSIAATTPTRSVPVYCLYFVQWRWKKNVDKLAFRDCSRRQSRGRDEIDENRREKKSHNRRKLKANGRLYLYILRSEFNRLDTDQCLRVEILKIFLRVIYYIRSRAKTILFRCGQ